MDEKALRQFHRIKMHEIWEKVKSGEPLFGEEKTIGEAMLEHEEYYNVWEFADVTSDYEYDVDEVNPFMHILMHTIVENQLRNDEPKEVRKTLNRLLKKYKSRHEVIHKIARALSEEVFQILKFRTPYNERRYIKKLKKIT